MRTLRLLLTFWLCLSLPYAAVASALRDPGCVAGMPKAAQEMTPAADAAMSMHHLHGHGDAGHTMPMQAATNPSAHHAAHGTMAAQTTDHGCLLSCACLHACAAPAFTADYSRSGMLATAMRQESPRLPPILARRAPSLTELLRPPTSAS